MVVSTQTTLALRCQDCGRLGFYGLSRFSLSKGKKTTFYCECGAPIVVISSKGGKAYYLQLECFMCDSKHLFTFSGTDLWGDQVLTLACSHTAIEIGFAGPRERVMQSVKRLEGVFPELAENTGYDTYFHNPEIMYQAMEILNKMSEEGRMYCGCGGSQLDVEVFPDRIELNCRYCGAAGLIPAENGKDLESLRRMTEISLDSGAYGYRKKKNIRNRRPVKK